MSADDDNFGEALRVRMAPYTGSASWCCLVMAVMTGKAVRYNVGWVRRLSIPACLIGGLVGYGMWNVVHQVPGPHAVDWRDSWDECSLLLMTLVFASLFLSLPMPHTLVGVLREGMPQLLYGQVLCWGQYVVAILVGELARCAFPAVSPLATLLIPFGLEGGWSTLLFAEVTLFPQLSDEVNSLKHFAYCASELGLVLSLVLGVALVNLPIAYNPLSKHTRAMRKRRKRAKDDDDEGLELRAPSQEHVHEAKQSLHSLGLHLGVVTVASFLAYLLQVVLVGIDVAIQHAELRILSVVPLFSLAMITSHLLTKVYRRFAVFKQLNRATFARLCITILELQVVLDTAAVRLEPLRDFQSLDQVMVFSIVMLALVLWNAFGLFFMAPRLCPNHPYIRGVAEGAQLLGLTWTGLLWIKVMDPRARTPVLMAYASKQLIHNVIMSGGIWSTHVVTLADHVGIWPTFACALAGLLFWCVVYRVYVRPKMPARTVRSRGPSSASRSEAREEVVAPPLAAASNPAAHHDPQRPISLHSVVPGPSPSLPLPTLVGASSIFNSAAPFECKRLPHLMTALPTMAQAKSNWELVYNLTVHGSSLRTLYRQSAEYHSGANSNVVHSAYGNIPCVIVVEDSWGYVFGAYCTELPLHGVEVRSGAGSGQRGGRYFGDGDCFVFTFEPEFEFWGWSGANECFALARESLFAFGGPEPAIMLDADLECGRSERSPTYGNRRLACFKEFRAVTVEVWALNS